MEDLDLIYAELKLINFDGLEFGRGEDGNTFKVIVDSKLFLENHCYQIKNCRSDVTRKIIYDELKEVYDELKKPKPRYIRAT